MPDGTSGSIDSHTIDVVMLWYKKKAVWLAIKMFMVVEDKWFLWQKVIDSNPEILEYRQALGPNPGD